MNSVFQRVQRTLRFQYLRVVHRSHNPHVGAMSFALGVFLGFLPISMFATVLAVLLPRKLGLRVVPTVIGTFAGNWVTAPFVLGSSVVVGQFLTTGGFTGFKQLMPPEKSPFIDIFNFYLQMGGSFFLGILVVSLIGAVIAYAVVFWSTRAALRLRKARILSRLHLPHPHRHAP